MIGQSLDQLYEVYGFKKKKSANNKISVYTYDIGYFHNADIVYDDGFEADASRIKLEFESCGYASQLIKYTSLEHAEQSLFDGFFSIAETKKKLADNYIEYCDKHTLSSGSTYEYIPSSFYSSTSCDVENKNLANEVVNLLDGDQPRLIVIEAAAGFGKTTTVHEIIKIISNSNKKTIPFLAELSKNRQAQIFKYVLLDEINRQFPTLNLEVVTFHIRKGDVILIIDGFDELLRKSEELDDNKLLESAEPMLETISSLLKGSAKVILTTRKTALFSGDGFHCWMENHAHEFSVQRFTLQEPNPEQWVGRERKNKLTAAGFDLSLIPNPVLLSWLRGQTDEQFEEICKKTEKLIDNYFEQLLEREKERQALYATPDEQQEVFRHLANYLITIESTSDTKENIEKTITSECKGFIKTLRQRYSSDERPTEEQVVEKLSLHALLDRKQNGNVGFVNDFVFGYFIGETLIQNGNNEWIVEDERFLEYAITSFRNRGESIKSALWNIINFYIDLTSSRNKYQSDIFLKGKIQRNYNAETFEELSFKDTYFGDAHSIFASTFSNCIFRNCQFNFNHINDSYFINCRFYDSTPYNLNTDDIFFGCLFERSANFIIKTTTSDSGLIQCTEWERHVLTKIWPPGAARLSTRRALTTIKMGIAPEHTPHIDDAIENLRRRNIINVENETIVVNISEIKTIKECLGRS